MGKLDLNEYPQPAILGAEERLAALNEKAAALFPSWKAGDMLPDVLLLPQAGERWEGTAALEGRRYRVSAVPKGEQTLYLLAPEEQIAMSDGQMDGALYQMRTLMGQFRRELAPYVSGEQETLAREDLEDFSKSYYQMLRLVDHMDLLRDAADGHLAGERRELDLDVLCRQIALECGALLRELGIEVVYEGSRVPVTVLGDEQLLRDALLELISNCAKRRRSGGELTLRLTRRGWWARICVTDDGPRANSRERLALTSRGGLPLIPTPDAGAGLGLSVVQTIAALHRGSVLVSADGERPKVYVALPLASGSRESHTLHASRPERNAGMNPYLIALSDVLSGETIREDWKE